LAAAPGDAKHLYEFKMMRLFRVCGLLLLLTGTPWSADQPPVVPQDEPQQAALVPGSSLYDAATPFRLFDPSRLTMRHSYSVSYFSGSSSRSGSIGMYMNSIGYQVSRPLYLQLDLGIVHNPGALWGSPSGPAGAQLRPNLFLRYAPSPRFQLIVDFRTVPAFYHSYGYGYGPWPY
jgi:hypothetical protein